MTKKGENAERREINGKLKQSFILGLNHFYFRLRVVEETWLLDFYLFSVWCRLVSVKQGFQWQ